MRSLWDRFTSLARELFDVQLEAAELERLERFVELLEAWSEKINLVSAGSREEIVTRHLLDSLAPSALLPDVTELADFGSGAGFPGIPLAVLNPGARVHLIEARRRRSNFLRHVVRSLSLSNATVHEIRAENWRPGSSIGAVVGRAIRADVLAGLALPVLVPTGSLIVMRKAVKAETPLRGFLLEAIVQYRLPGNQRHEVARYRKAGVASDCFT